METFWLRLADLVDLVDIDARRVGRLRDRSRPRAADFREQVFHVLADVAGFGERGRVADGERHVQALGQRLGEQRLARAGRADQKNVRLIDVDMIFARRAIFIDGGLQRAEPLVVIVHRNRERPLRVILADDVRVEQRFQFARLGDVCEAGQRARGELALFLLDDVVGEIDAVGADEDVGRAFDHRADVAGGFAAERAGGHASAAEVSAAPTASAATGSAAARRLRAAAGWAARSHRAAIAVTWTRRVRHRLASTSLLRCRHLRPP